MKNRQRVLVTAGSTMVMIDKVRGLTNVFHGKTGTEIAFELARRGHYVTLLTSGVFLFKFYYFRNWLRLLWSRGRVDCVKYVTFDELLAEMGNQICNCAPYDVIIHSAAVSDYKVEGVYYDEEIAPDSCSMSRLRRVDSSAKISSDFESLYLRLVLTPKIIDFIRPLWKFKGKLVKFKLQVGISDDALLEIARKSRTFSNADIIVANCLETSHEYAYICDEADKTFVTREQLPAKLAERLGL